MAHVDADQAVSIFLVLLETASVIAYIVFWIRQSLLERRIGKPAFDADREAEVIWRAERGRRTLRFMRILPTITMFYVFCIYALWLSIRR